MSVVLDVDAAVALSTGKASNSLQDAISRTPRVLVPELFDFEATNVVWKYFRAGACDATDAGLLLERTLAWPDLRVAGTTLATEALALAREYAHPAYDMFYIALARRHDAHLLTLDRQLARVARKAGVRASSERGSAHG